MQIKEEDQLGNLLCWVRLGHHLVLMKLSLAEVAVVNGGGLVFQNAVMDQWCLL